LRLRRRGVRKLSENRFTDGRPVRRMDRIEEEFGFEPINPGSVYRALKQMENEGLCRSEWDVRAEEGGPPRRMYSITDEGGAYLKGG
jgi:DNA-binding PadR family transcriptional regulator